MKDLDKILAEFKTLKEYSDFMQELVEKKADGQEIARGMDQHDKSKEQKSDNTYVSKKVSKSSDGSAEETHYAENTPEPPPPEEPAQPLPPGSQVTIGNKKLSPQLTKPTTVKIDMDGGKEKINVSPRIDKNPNNNLK